MRLAGSIVTLLSGAAGAIMGFFAYSAVGTVLSSPEITGAISEGNDSTISDDQILAIAQGAAGGIVIFGIVMSIVVLLMGVWMFRTRSMAPGIIAIVGGVLALFGGQWIAMIGGVVGGILFIVGRNK